MISTNENYLVLLHLLQYELLKLFRLMPSIK